MKPILETIAFNVESCYIAQAAGVQRIELCDNPGDGGTTASYGFIKAARKILNIPLYPIIRPRGGHFFYTDAEFEIMKEDVRMCKNLGCDGVVIGILNKDATINKLQCSRLIQLAYPMGVSFHRAFDRVINMEQALQDAIEIGCERILTSGLHPTAIEGLQNIKHLVALAKNDIIIMPGSGIRAENILQIAQATNALEYHSSAKKYFENVIDVHNETMNENLQTVGIDETEIKLMLKELALIN